MSKGFGGTLPAGATFPGGTILQGGPLNVRASRIIYIEGDDGTMTIDTIPGMTRNDIMQAAIIITDMGRILKDRSGVIGGSVSSFDLVKQSPRKKEKEKKKSIYRSIFDPTDIQAEL